VAGVGILVLCCLGLLAGCVGSAHERFFTLIGPSASSMPAVGSAAIATDLRVEITSVTVPEAVDRAELVMRTGPNDIRILEDCMWAESLRTAVARVLAGQMSEQLGGAMVATRADNAGRNAKYMVTLDLTRFDSLQDEAAVIDALWEIRTVSGSVAAGHTALREAVGGKRVDDMVAAQARALASLGREIAGRIAKIEEEATKAAEK